MVGLNVLKMSEEGWATGRMTKSLKHVNMNEDGQGRTDGQPGGQQRASNMLNTSEEGHARTCALTHPRTVEQSQNT